MAHSARITVEDQPVELVNARNSSLQVYIALVDGAGAGSGVELLGTDDDGLPQAFGEGAPLVDGAPVTFALAQGQVLYAACDTGEQADVAVLTARG